MKLIPMGEYYVWHCDWCDSTNHTPWSRLDCDDLACAACHHHLVPPGVKSTANRYPAQSRRPPVSAGIAC
ncbi:MAG TPA: hypothetical protein VFF53_09095 [Geobacteraceae bacterium]|nr:hypothetical protein [Geobacteraceae bacterium]